MKNIAFAAGLCLLVFASCKKTSDTEEILALSKEKTLSVCSYDPEVLEVSLRKRKPTPPTNPTEPTPTEPTPTPTPTPPPPTGSGYSCILVDFDGQSVTNANWNYGSTINCSSSGLSSAQITQVLDEVRALYAAYNVVITYDENIYNAANQYKRTRVVVTSTSNWYAAGHSGVAYTGSFTWGDQTPAFVFSDRLYYTPHYVAEIVAHEAGHTLGLTHQKEYDSNCTLTSNYKNGAVMGNSLNSSQGQWIYGTTSTCYTYQDDNSMLRGILGSL